MCFFFLASNVTTDVGGRSGGVSGAAVGAGLAASATVLIAIALLILFAVWMIKKTKVNETKLLG